MSSVWQPVSETVSNEHKYSEVGRHPKIICKLVLYGTITRKGTGVYHFQYLLVAVFWEMLM